jgi:hypothetical protein
MGRPALQRLLLVTRPHIAIPRQCRIFLPCSLKRRKAAKHEVQLANNGRIILTPRCLRNSRSVRQRFLTASVALIAFTQPVKHLFLLRHRCRAVALKHEKLYLGTSKLHYSPLKSALSLCGRLSFEFRGKEFLRSKYWEASYPV